MINLVPTHFEQLALDLANTYDPCVTPRDLLSDPGALAGFLKAHGISYSPAELDDSGRLLTPVRDTLRLIPAQSNDQCAKQTLLMLIAQAQWRIAAADDPRSPAQLVPVADSAGQRVMQMAVLGALSLVARHGVGRIRRCKAAPCEEVFCDSSKSGRQVFCSKRCANRFGAAQFRRRLADSR